MTRVALLFAVAFIGCAPSSPGARSSESSSGAPAQRALPDATSWCPTVYAGDERYTKCLWRVVSRGYCGGAVPTAEQQVPTPGCICDGCATDADCPGSASGRCAEVPSVDAYCDPPARVCVPDGEPCPPVDAGAQANRVQWRHDNEGHATCSAQNAPPP